MSAKVRYHEMLPHEIVARRAGCPVAFLPLGTLEWHGEHLAVGLDGLKAERLAELAAAASGGFAFPTLWYGEPRATQHMDGSHADSPAIRRALGLRPPAAPDPAAEIPRFQALLRSVVLQAQDCGMEVVCVICGHYPLREWAAPVAEQLNARDPKTATLVGCDADFVATVDGDAELAGMDHAGFWETSYLLNLCPECADLSVYEGRDVARLLGVLGEDPRASASAQVGAAACDRIVEAIVALTGAALERLEALGRAAADRGAL